MEVEMSILKLDQLINEAEEAKQMSMALANFLKRGKANKWLNTAYAMVGDTVTVYSFTSGATLFITMSVNKLEGFKDSRLEGILTAFEFLNPDDTTTREFAAYRSKETTYVYNAPVPEQEFKVTIRVTITANIIEDSTTCRQVIVGMTAPKPQPIYKLVCDGEDDPTVDSHPMPPMTEENA